MPSESELTRVIVKGKKRGYASGIEPKENADGSKTLTYSENGFDYTDTWYGSDSFGGEEVVRFQGIRVWHMVYHGGLTKQKFDKEKQFAHPKQIFTFLQKALSHVTETEPFRGPSEFKEDDFVYRNTVKGDINNFEGYEEILFNGEVVHTAKYLGGRVD